MHIVSYTNYYPFGMAQLGRNWSSGKWNPKDIFQTWKKKYAKYNVSDNGGFHPGNNAVSLFNELYTLSHESVGWTIEWWSAVLHYPACEECNYGLYWTLCRLHWKCKILSHFPLLCQNRI